MSISNVHVLMEQEVRMIASHLQKKFGYNRRVAVEYVMLLTAEERRALRVEMFNGIRTQRQPDSIRPDHRVISIDAWRGRA